ncbi:MAG: hypothetical protein JXR78_02385 [Victivallales bacterium]|nr:hypothetical protein [Victivallales bacterium]
MNINHLWAFLTKYRWFLVAIPLTAVYSALFGIYINNDVDNTWSTAWIYNLWNYGIQKDIVFCENDESYWGVKYFSHIYCYFYGALLSVLGWTKYNVFAISLGLTTAGLFFWKKIADRIFKDSDKVFVFISMLALSGVVIATANKARSDAFVFMFMALSIYLFIGRHYFFSMLSACVAVETHPIGVITFFYLASYVFCFEQDILFLRKKKELGQIAAGVFCGIVIYLLLHYNNLSGLQATLNSGTSSGPSNFLAAHFWGRSSYWFRFIPELVIFIAAYGFHFVFFKKEKIFFPLTALMILVSSFLLRRGNFHYAVFAYPAFLMLAVNTFSRPVHGMKLLLLLWMLLMIPQYALLTWKNNPGRDYPQYIRDLSKVSFAENTRIYGMPSDWFALCRYREFRDISSFRNDVECYVIRHHGTIYMVKDYAYRLDNDPARWQIRIIITIKPKSGGIIEILHITPIGLANHP